MEISKLEEAVLSAAHAYYNAIENNLIKYGYSKSSIQEQRDRIHYALLWMIKDDLVELDGDTHQGTLMKVALRIPQGVTISFTPLLQSPL